MQTFIYCAETDANGVLTVQRFNEGCDNSVDERWCAERYPEVIYFEVTPGTMDAVLKAMRPHADAVLGTVAMLLANLGSKSEWSMDDNFYTTESIAELADVIGLPSVGNQKRDDLIFWNTVNGSDFYDEDTERDFTIGGAR